MNEATLIQYYVAVRGRLGDGALALLAARAALLGHAAWRRRSTYARWHARVMTKVVLGADPADLDRVRFATETLALTESGDVVTGDVATVLLVLPPQPKAALLDLVGGLRLAPKQRGQTPEPASTAALVLVAAADLGMHGGKLAAQCAHAALLAHTAYGRHPAWPAWVDSGRPMALRRALSVDLASLERDFPGGAVHDAGHTQVPAGALTVLALPPWSSAAAHWRATGEPW
jgi:PTH2 family peptidyl-tRNA hydrolase